MSHMVVAAVRAVAAMEVEVMAAVAMGLLGDGTYNEIPEPFSKCSVWDDSASQRVGVG
jgi:hypothetical protein